jgi:hypothetical protein
MTNETECKPSVGCESAAVHSYLNILQSVINRMASNCAGCKTWCITLVSAIIVVLLNNNKCEFIYIALAPTILFLLLDSYYLAMEKSFRDKYNSFIEKLHSDRAFKSDLFVVSPEKAVNSFLILNSFKSISVWPFYVALIAVIIVIRNVLI